MCLPQSFKRDAFLKLKSDRFMSCEQITVNESGARASAFSTASSTQGDPHGQASFKRIHFFRVFLDASSTSSPRAWAISSCEYAATQTTLMLCALTFFDLGNWSTAFYGRTRIQTPTTMTTQVLSFMDVPREIRMLIYDKLVGDRVFWVNFPHDGSLQSRILGSLAILRVNKQVRVEAQRALRVRTLRVNKCNMVDVNLFSRVPRIISVWAATIESALVGYHSYEFNALIGRSDHSRRDRVLAGLQDVVVHLPKLAALTVTCDNLPGRSNDRELGGFFLRFSQNLCASLPLFNRIRVFTKDVTTLNGESELEVEIKLLKATPAIPRQSSAVSQPPVCTYIQNHQPYNLTDYRIPQNLLTRTFGEFC